MAKKKNKARGGNKPRGYYCRVCGEHKANEKFSGGGHAAHICKTCASLPLAERNEQLTLRKIEGMAFRHLSEAEIKWLRGKMNDPRPEVAGAAKEAHGMKFPRYERGQRKKGLTAFSLELFIHGDIWDEYGDEVPVHARVELDDTGLLRRTDYDAQENEGVIEITVDRQDARKFLKSVIHELDALFWDEDLSDAGDGEYGDDPYLDVDDEDFEDSGIGNTVTEAKTEAPAEDMEPDGNRLPVWSLVLELNNGEDKVITFYNQLHDAPQELYWSLMEWFADETADDDFDGESDGPEE